jgi:hypothetical protein
MLRSIADIARSEGEPLSDAGTKLACLEVFALGGAKPDDDGVDTGYFAVRAALAGAMTEATRYLAEHGLASSGAPTLVRFLSKIASRYSIQVSEKAAAQAIPLLGAAGGATINMLFMDHFQNMARGHFIVRRLERTYGKEPVREAYRVCHARRFLAGIHLKYIPGDSLEENLEGSIREKNDTIQFVSARSSSACRLYARDPK